MKRLMEWILPYIMGIYHKMEKLTEKEKLAQENYFKKINLNVQRKAKKPVVIAMVGLIGSGKSHIADKIALAISGVVLKADDVRIELRKVHEKYEGTRKITENIAVELLDGGINVILDSDYIDDKKRASIRGKVKKTGAKIIFVRTLCDRDIMLERILEQKFEKSRDDFFGGASTKAKENTGVIVKLRELWRRTPQHYRWINESGGKWVPRKLSFKHIVVNTDNIVSINGVLRTLGESLK